MHQTQKCTTFPKNSLGSLNYSALQKCRKSLALSKKLLLRRAADSQSRYLAIDAQIT